MPFKQQVKLKVVGDKDDNKGKGQDEAMWCELVGCGFPARVEGLDVLVVEPTGLAVLPEDRVGEVRSEEDHPSWMMNII